MSGLKWIAVLAALSGATAVIGGAFGAHWAQGPAADWCKTGGQYQLIHAVAALVAVRMGAKWPAILFVAGSVLFAGSLYAMAALGPVKAIGPVTPLGGLIMIVGWFWLAWDARRQAA